MFAVFQIICNRVGESESIIADRGSGGVCCCTDITMDLWGVMWEGMANG